jgi:hypothetical protein
MSERQARINLTNLPLRARKLNRDEIRNVFGGCLSAGMIICFGDSDCCPMSERPNKIYPLRCMGGMCMD